MRKRRLIVGLAAVLILGLGAATVRYFWQGPLGSRRAIQRWAREANDRDPQTRKKADELLLRARDPVRVCLTLLAMEPTWWDGIYAAFGPKVFPKLPPRIAQAFPPPNVDYRFYPSVAIRQLGLLGPRATNAVSTLVPLLDETDKFLRDAVIRTIGRIGPGAAPAVPKLARLLDDLNYFDDLKANSDRDLARLALSGMFNRANPETARELVQATLSNRLNRANGNFRPIQNQEVGSVVTALGEIGVRNEAAIQALARSLTNRNWQLRLGAAEALWKVEREPQRLLQFLAKWDPTLDARDDYRRPMAGLAAEIAAVERQAFPILVRFLKDPRMDIRLIASKALYRFDGQTNTHVRVLKEILKEGSENDRWSAIDVLTDLAVTSETAVPLIISTLKDQSNRVRGKTAAALGKLGSSAEAVIPALQEALHDTHSNVQEAAAEALANIQTARTGKPSAGE
jgi:HEAT repeat protein